MMFWILAGALTAAVLGLIVSPLRKEHKRLTWLLIFLIPLVSLALYLWGGNPELAH